jgi:hypothetical protein
MALGGLAVLGFATVTLAASDPALARGQVLVLDNERTMEGDIQCVGDDYRIRRAQGEVWVPGAKVLRLCADWQDAYAFLITRANLGDSDERIRLARWCQLHDLKKEALAEADAAVALRPYNEEARRLQSLLRRAIHAPRPSTAAPHSSDSSNSLPPVDLSTETLSAFVTHIQPILMNTCASCHANKHAGTFRLIRCYQGGTLNQQATQNNLAAVMAEIDRKRPELSPLLIKAVSSHGKSSTTPLKGRQCPAYRHLESWVQETLATNPHLVAATGQPTTAGTSPQAKEGPQSAASKPPQPMADVGTYHTAAPAAPDDRGAVAVVAMSGLGLRAPPVAPQAALSAKSLEPPEVSSSAAVVRPTPPPEGAPPPQPADEFDAIIFNQQAQPVR